MSTKLEELFLQCVAVAGEDATRAALEATASRVSEAVSTLTIVANAGVHKIPDRYLIGEVYEASRGNFDASSQDSIVKEIRVILIQLHKKLQEKEWSQIYLIPTGHPVLAAQIKTFIYRVARINTIDLLYLNGEYFEVNLDHRRVVLGEHAS